MGMLDKLILVLGRVFTPSRAMLTAMAVVLLAYMFVVALPPLTFYRAMAALTPNEAWPTDHEPYLFSRLSRMLETGHDGYRVAWIGGSTMRESLWSENELAQQIGSLTDEKVDVVDLTSSGQKLGLSLALAERASCAGKAQMIVLGLNPRRLHRLDLIDARPLMGYRSTETEAKDSSWRSEFGANLKASIALRGRVLGAIWDSLIREIEGKKPRTRHRYINRPPDHASIEKVAAASTLQDWDELDRFLDIFENVVGRCGARTVFMLTPINPLLLEEPRFESFRVAYDKLAHDIASRTGGKHLIEANQRVLLRTEDFQDWGHLSSESAIRRVTGAAAADIAKLIKDEIR